LSDLGIVCTIIRRVTRWPAVYEVRLGVHSNTISKREFDCSTDATAEAERLHRQFVDNNVPS